MVAGAQSKALTKGSPYPEKAKENLRLFSGRFCPFAHRTRLALNHKQLPYEIVNVDLKEKPEWYSKISPLGKVPLLEEAEERRTAESLIIVEYLDDKYPDKNPTLSTDPLKRAQQKMVVEVITSKIMGPHQQTILKGEPENKEALLKALDEIEQIFLKSYSGLEPISFVDLMIWPWFERLPAIEQLRNMQFPRERFPAIMGWCDRMRQEPSVQSSAQPTEVHLEWYKTRNPNVGL
ncbi:pyrimidodiazepine synthase-like [Paramacrobiotus metropolitanus]|uniref:pyrimidodiazepine synthase-like n=1 Tax=Paramacrobiotus metropolitanus TaxID=2943436 RepID=UPI002445F9D8|nr:pyrimidodiazepine synthase-like [Paramacrobiotus metropolitanus]